MQQLPRALMGTGHALPRAHAGQPVPATRHPAPLVLPRIDNIHTSSRSVPTRTSSCTVTHTESISDAYFSHGIHQLGTTETHLFHVRSQAAAPRVPPVLPRIPTIATLSTTDIHSYQARHQLSTAWYCPGWPGEVEVMVGYSRRVQEVTRMTARSAA